MGAEVFTALSAGVKLLARLGGALLSLRNGRSAALRGFKEGLLSQGVPQYAADYLSSFYPDLDLLLPGKLAKVMNLGRR